MIPTGSGLQGRKERETSVSGLFDTKGTSFPKQAFLTALFLIDPALL